MANFIAPLVKSFVSEIIPIATEGILRESIFHTKTPEEIEEDRLKHIAYLKSRKPVTHLVKKIGPGNRIMYVPEEKINTGGLIHKILKDNLTKKKLHDSYPIQLNNLVNLITIHDPYLEKEGVKNTIQRIGSATLKIQKYFSDIDINETLSTDTLNNNQIATIFSKELKKILKNIEKTKNVYFSDFKCGIDISGEPLRWSPNEIFSGKKGNVTLVNAILQKSVIKLDVIALIDGPRYIEMSTFFIIVVGNNNLNLAEDFYDKFSENIKNEIENYSSGEHIKLFKSVKRLWSLAKSTKNYSLLQKLDQLIDSNLSLISQISADLETISLMLHKVKTLPIKHIYDSIDNMKNKLATIPDINLDESYLDNKLDKLKSYFVKQISYYDRSIIIDEINYLNEYLLDISNAETQEYLNSVGINISDYYNPKGQSEILDKKVAKEQIKMLNNKIFEIGQKIAKLERSKGNEDEINKLEMESKKLAMESKKLADEISKLRLI